MERTSLSVPELGRELAEYAWGKRTFLEIEETVAEAMRTSIIAPELLRRLYHVINHYEADRPLRSSAASGGAAAQVGLDHLAERLQFGNEAEIASALDVFWRGEH